MSILKKILLFLFFFILTILLTKSNTFRNANTTLLQIYNRDLFEYTNEDRSEILEVPKIESNHLVDGAVYVPDYWKYGKNTQTDDYLQGYVPNIRSFKDYWSIHNNLSYSYNPYNSSYSVEEIFTNFQNTNQIHKTLGIKNESTYFEWDTNECKIFNTTNYNTSLFLCPNWVNWTGIDILEKEYVLVECELEEIKGYCLFEDYVRIYYSTRRYGETRCFGENDFYCEFTQYLDIVSLN